MTKAKRSQRCDYSAVLPVCLLYENAASSGVAIREKNYSFPFIVKSTETSKRERSTALSGYDSRSVREMEAASEGGSSWKFYK